ncbi:MAG: YqaA family protein [Thermodesulfobacteriota bacterium]
MIQIHHRPYGGPLFLANGGPMVLVNAKKGETGKSLQILVFGLFLAFTLAGAFLATFYLNLEEFLLYGYWGIFLINLIGSATIIFPVPGEAFNIGAAATLNPLYLGVIASVGAAIGEPTCYFAGRWGRKVIGDKYLERYQKAEFWLRRYGSFAIFIFALLPILIFDLLGIAAGAFRYPLWKFVLFCWMGRLIRSLLEAYLGWAVFGFLPWLS